MILDGLGIANTPLTKVEWGTLRRLLKGNRRMLFSQNFIEKETEQLEEFRATFREIMNLLDKRKDLIRFLFTEPESSDIEGSPQKEWDDYKRGEYHMLKNQILYMLTQHKSRRRVTSKKRTAQVLDLIRELKIMPISVQ